MKQIIIEVEGVWRWHADGWRHHFSFDSINKRFLERNLLVIRKFFVEIFGADKENSMELRVFQIFVEKNWKKFQQILV